MTTSRVDPRDRAVVGAEPVATISHQLGGWLLMHSRQAGMTTAGGYRRSRADRTEGSRAADRSVHEQVKIHHRVGAHGHDGARDAAGAGGAGRWVGCH